MNYKIQFIYVALFILFLALQISAGVIEGTVYDYNSGEKIPVVTIRVEGTGKSMAANEDGFYRFRLTPGKYRLKFSHIAHYSETVEIEIADSSIISDVRLRPSMIILKGIKAYTRAYDPAQRIILEAIRRKAEILSKIKSYSVDAYLKVVVRDRSKDTNDIYLIVESQIESHWEQPNKYKEILLARKLSANLAGQEIILGTGQLMNFNQNRIDFGDFKVVSPTATDALDYYNYYLLDTLLIDSKPVFHLEIEPKSNTKPLFVGTIDIADSSFEVVGVDLGFNKAFDMPFLDSLRYSQICAEFENEFWMPVEVRLTGNVKIPFPGLPSMSFAYVAAPHDYKFNILHEKERFSEFVWEVDENVDNVDSTGWNIGQVIPLTDEERLGYKRIDSLANVPKPLWKKALMIPLGALAVAAFSENIFHFNRVEGAYLGGFIWKRNAISGLDLYLRSGWAFKGELWQHHYALTYYFNNKYRPKIRFAYHNEVTRRQSIMSNQSDNVTLMSLADKLDPFDYYLEEGFSLGVSAGLLKKTTIDLEYNDFLQSSVDNSTEFSLFRKSKKHRLNPAINDGRFRSISARITWDSRPLMKNKRNRVGKLDYGLLSRIRFGFEYSGRDFIKSDFHFRRFELSLYHEKQLFNLGQSSIFLYGGLSEYNLPPQSSFIVDYSGIIFVRPISFKTLGENNFEGNKAAVVYYQHDFGRNLFEWSHIPLIKDIPFSIGIHGGAFWASQDKTNMQTDAYHGIADKAYHEIGFSIGRITPFRYRLYFTWQLSDYVTEKFAITLGGDLF